MAVEKDLQRVEGAIEALARLFQGPRPAARRAARAGVDLSRTAQKLLWHVVTESPIRISDLARSLDRSDAAVSRQVKALQEAGLVQRRTSAEDGRVAFVTPTARGRGVGERLRSAADRIFREQLNGWTGRDLSQLARHLERLVVDLRRRPDGRA